MDQNEVSKLTTYIDENIRSSSSSGIMFVDTRQFLSRIRSKQNHVVFGRRGAGKTTLVQSARDPNNYLDVYINLEDHKDITFPNIVIRILLELFSILDSKLSNLYPWYRFSFKAYRIRRSIKGICRHLEDYLHQPDVETQNIRTKAAYYDKISAGLSAAPATAQLGAGHSKTREVNRILP